jgi:ribosomal protein L7/L12
LVPSDLRLEVIKWVKRNLMYRDGSDIGLKEAKDIGDRLAEIIHDKTI